MQTTVGDIYGNKIYEWLVRKEPLSYVPLLITPATLPPGPKGPGFRVVYRMNTEMPKMRPAVLSRASMLFLNEVLSFRHFVRHAYGCPLDEKKLRALQTRIRDEFALIGKDLRKFRTFVVSLAETS